MLAEGINLCCPLGPLAHGGNGKVENPCAAHWIRQSVRKIKRDHALFIRLLATHKKNEKVNPTMLAEGINLYYLLRSTTYEESEKVYLTVLCLWGP
jgi:hypothetical protein